ncbi:MAG TPA: PfkB family carbohydrate kinase, partial [Pyrinomonadaceae bacterium]|nr:PfkB family carbohydrate kinase [Pyrinomonadaceae bacterium]
MNLASLGARAAIVGAVGDDETGRALLDKLEAAGVDCGGVIVRPGLRTTTKVRILAGQAHSPRQQVIRVDYEGGAGGEALAGELSARLGGVLASAEAVVVSDYNYGAGGEAVTEFVRREAAGKILLADSRFRLEAFRGFTSATPNEEEVERWAGRPLEGVKAVAEAGERLRALLGLRALLVTRGKNGFVLVEEGEDVFSAPAVGSHDAVDVTGAGDTVIATYALALASGASFRDAARLANHAGGIVVLKRGTATVSAAELLASVEGAGEAV